MPSSLFKRQLEECEFPGESDEGHGSGGANAVVAAPAHEWHEVSVDVDEVHLGIVEALQDVEQSLSDASEGA